jgi:hypothetical protein
MGRDLIDIGNVPKLFDVNPEVDAPGEAKHSQIPGMRHIELNALRINKGRLASRPGKQFDLRSPQVQQRTEQQSQRSVRDFVPPPQALEKKFIRARRLVAGQEIPVQQIHALGGVLPDTPNLNKIAAHERLAISAGAAEHTLRV